MHGWILLLALLLAGNACAADVPAQPAKVLFVGNSLTYVGNLPATYAALSAANGHPVHSQMIVEGGAFLDERHADGSLQRALAEQHPQVLVLQEQGGALLCMPDEATCARSRSAVAAMAQLGREHDAKVLLLGSYQAHPAVSRLLSAKELAAAQAANVPYVEISEALRKAATAAPDLPWYNTDGMHPGPALTLLDAIQLYRTIHGHLPQHGFTVTAPIYTPNSGLDAALRNADDNAPLAGTPSQIDYPEAMIHRLNTLLAPQQP